jgi:rubredoxin
VEINCESFVIAEMKSDGGFIDEQRKLACEGRIEARSQLELFFSATSSEASAGKKFGPLPTTVRCPNCKCIAETRTEFESSMQTHVVAAMLIP